MSSRTRDELIDVEISLQNDSLRFFFQDQLIRRVDVAFAWRLEIKSVLKIRLTEEREVKGKKYFGGQLFDDARLENHLFE